MAVAPLAVSIGPYGRPRGNDHCRWAGERNRPRLCSWPRTALRSPSTARHTSSRWLAASRCGKRPRSQVAISGALLVMDPRKATSSEIRGDGVPLGSCVAGQNEWGGTRKPPYRPRWPAGIPARRSHSFRMKQGFQASFLPREGYDTQPRGHCYGKEKRHVYYTGAGANGVGNGAIRSVWQLPRYSGGVRPFGTDQTVLR